MPRWKTVSMPPDSVPAGRHKSSSADALQMARRAQGSDTGPPVLEIAVARHRSRPVPTPTDPVHALLSESQRRDCPVPLPVLLSGFPRDAPLAFPATPTARRLRASPEIPGTPCPLAIGSAASSPITHTLSAPVPSGSDHRNRRSRPGSVSDPRRLPVGLRNAVAVSPRLSSTSSTALPYQGRTKSSSEIHE